MTDAAASRSHLSRRALAALGGAARRRVRFVLVLAALAFGVLREALHPASWRRTVRAEFARALRQTVGSGLSTTLATAALIGLVMVGQTLYWLGAAGQESAIGNVLASVLVREVAPVLVGFILLGRGGVVIVAEVGMLQLGGQVRALAALGLDPFLLVVLPRATAFALAAFTLGMAFVLVALVTGFLAETLLGASSLSLPTFLEQVPLAMAAGDFVVFPAKMIAIGLLVALTAAVTALEADPRDELARLLPQGFMRGVTAILVTSVALSLAA